MPKPGKFILVTLGKQTWALPLVDSSDFFQLKNLTPLPYVGDKVLGLTYHNGHLITLLNSYKILGVKTTLPSDHCLRIDWQGEHYGLVIDKVGEVILPDKVSQDYIVVDKNKIPLLAMEKLIKELF